ncbi:MULTISPECIES: PAS domain S-box protein [unclassified Coleofasciculus]|uniref:PAS domain S-box protein n=1 Tax=unclassified Coleofasciculus TaxID=2692782 RepID=UPI00188210DF|nr:MULTISPECIES: PAS domain S-box protein [unclassified Coleofasciculus]MBE9126549.1 PAS domain S-box protein [Coleofasciculus sp. LEGE 07081]MBE9149983.1 PAS domain S-box protein [Coleofasciculus sp. LEGE 07092]
MNRNRTGFRQLSRINIPVQRQRKLILAIPVTCLVTSLCAFGWLQVNTAKAEDWVQHTQQVRLETKRLLTALLDAETAVRGYDITRRQEFLNRYDTAIAEIPVALEQLRQFVADNHSQAHRLRRIQALVTTRVNLLNRNLQLTPSLPDNTIASPELVAQLLEGKQTMERTRTEINQFLAVESRLQLERQQRLWQQRWLTWLVLSLSGVIGISGSVLAAYLLNRLEQKLSDRDRSLRQSEARYRAVAENFPNGVVLLFNPELRYLLVDGKGLAAVDISKEQLEGKTIWECLPPEICSVLEPIYRQALAGVPTTTEIPYGDRIFLVYALPITSEGGDIFAGMVVSQDITDRKLSEQQLYKANRALRTLSECNQAVVRAVDEPTLLNDICRIVVEFGGYHCAWIGFAEHDDAKTVRPIAQAGYEDGYIESLQLTWSNTERGRGPTGTAIRTGKTSIAYSILTDPNYLPWREAAIQQGYAASIALPLIVDSHPLGALNIYATESDAFDEAEVRLLTELANDLAYGIAALRTRIERQQAEEALRVSEERWQLALRGNNDAIWDWNIKTNEVFLSVRWKEMLGYEDDEIANHSDEWAKRVHPDDLGWVTQAIQDHIAGQTPYYITEHRLQCKDGRYKWILARGQAVWDEKGDAVRMVGSHTDISDRKQAERALQESEERFRAVFEQAAVGIALATASGEILGVNQRYCEITGYAESELLGQTLQKITHPDDRERTSDYLHQVMTGEMPTYSIEKRYIRKDGELQWVYASVSLVKNPENRSYALAVLEDIQNRKQTEEALRESESKFRAFLEAASEAVIVTNARSEIIVFNAKAEDLFGYNRTEVLGRTVEFLMPQRFRQNHTQHREHYRANPSKRSMGKTQNLFAQHKDGSEFPIEAGLSTIQTKNGTFVMTFLTNITERKQAEEEIQRLNHSLELRIQESETRYEQIVELAEEGIWVIDNQAKTTYVNQAMARMLGYTEADMLEHPMSDFMHTGDKILTNSPLSLQNPNLVQRKEVQLKTRDNRNIWAYMSTSPIVDEWGNLLWSCALVYDITERKLTEERLQESNERISLANAELARAARLKDEFLASMSHELRTPLNAILGLAEALQEEVYGGLTDRQRKSLVTIEHSGKHLLELINDILDLSKIESGKMALQIAPVSLASLYASSLTFVKQQAHAKRIRINSQMAEDIGEIEVDERRMRQVLVNLLSNAVKFTPEGGEVSLQVDADSDAETLQVSVSDTGIGIAPENLNQLFKPFVQLDSSLSRRYAGTGLGLALVRRIVDLHGGSVSLESELGKGSRFTVSLPWKKPESNQTVITEIEQRLGELPTIQQALIVEDSDTSAKQIARYLAELGAAALIHSQGEGTTDIVLRFDPDVIILDILLPNLSGWEVLAQLKSTPQTQGIPVLVISVVDESERAFELGASEYLLKPISRQPFQAALTRIFAGVPQRADHTALVVTPQSEQELPLILLAEDNEANIATLMDYLQIRGFRVILARNGMEAVEMTKQQKPNLILMDIQMPEMDGLEATRHIRAETDLTMIPIIAITALAMPGDREKCLVAGANDYMTKPVSLKKLMKLIAQYLEKTDSNREIEDRQ